MTSKSLATTPGAFVHVYQPAATAVPNSARSWPVIELPTNRQVMDPKTGMMTAQWQAKLAEILTAINDINQRMAQK